MDGSREKGVAVAPRPSAERGAVESSAVPTPGTPRSGDHNGGLRHRHFHPKAQFALLIADVEDGTGQPSVSPKPRQQPLDGRLPVAPQ